MSLGTRLLLDLGRVEQRGDNRGGTNANRHSGFHQFCAPLFAGLVAVVTHSPVSMACCAHWKAE